MEKIKVEINLPEAAKAIEEFRREPKKTFELISNEIRTAVSGSGGQSLWTSLSMVRSLSKLGWVSLKLNGWVSLVFSGSDS